MNESYTHIPWAAQEELYAELSRVSNVAALSPAERATYEENLRQYRDNLATLAASYKDGFEKGEKKRRDQIAHQLIALQMTDEFIAEATGLSLDEIQKLHG